MPGKNPKPFCYVCGGLPAEVGRISVRGKCAGCGKERMSENERQIREHRGPFFQHWRRRTVLAFGGAWPDDAPVDSRERSA